jgi:hypothetical protein
MAYVCLLLSGAALLVNGLATLGHLPRRDAGVLSLVVGAIQLALGAAFLSLDGTAGTAQTAAGIFLFGLTYAYSGLDALMNLGSKGLGWFCGMVAFVAVLLAAAWLAADPLLAVLWLGWAVLWGLMFASLALGRARLDPVIGWALVLASQVTATVPGFLGLAGAWPRGQDIAWLAALVLALLFVAALLLARRGAVASPRDAAPAWSRLPKP